MFCTVVVVWPAGSRVSGSMPTAMEKVPPLSPLEDGASGSLTVQADSRMPSAAAAAKDLIRVVRRRAVVMLRAPAVTRWCTTGGVRWDGAVSRDHGPHLREVAGTRVAVPLAVDEC